MPVEMLTTDLINHNPAVFQYTLVIWIILDSQKGSMHDIQLCFRCFRQDSIHIFSDSW